MYLLEKSVKVRDGKKGFPSHVLWAGSLLIYLIVSTMMMVHTIVATIARNVGVKPSNSCHPLRSSSGGRRLIVKAVIGTEITHPANNKANVSYLLFMSKGSIPNTESIHFQKAKNRSRIPVKDAMNPKPIFSCTTSVVSAFRNLMKNHTTPTRTAERHRNVLCMGMEVSFLEAKPFVSIRADYISNSQLNKQLDV